MPITVLYHADCLDGFAAAYAAWLSLGNTARYLAVHHGTPLPPDALSGRTIYLLDFSLAPEQLLELARNAQAVIQIDHHLSAWRDCAAAFGLDALPCDYTHPTLPLRLIFDLEHAGSALAWHHFHPGQALPLALRHIEENDLWRFTHPDTRAFCRALRLQPFHFDAWHALIESSRLLGEPYRDTVRQGQTLTLFLQREVERLALGAVPARLRGEPIDPLQALRHATPTLQDNAAHWQISQGLAVNANALFASELGNLLAEQSGTWGMSWHYAADGEIKVSLRACGHCDVAEIARRYGGGGHRNAAGFRMPAARFLQEILGR